MTQQRRLATIMFTDVVGYTAAMARDERHAHALVARAHEHARAFVERCGGQWLETVGDGSLSAFASASQAVGCALAIQDSLASDPELQLRIGLHVGDVVFSDDGVYGDGVNVASRVHALAPPGGTVVTEAIRSAVRGHANLRFTSLGRKRLKNVEEPVAVYRLAAGVSGPAGWLIGVGQRAAVAAAVLVIGLGSLAVFLATNSYLEINLFRSNGDSTPAGDSSIAVLPFHDLSPRGDQGHFADGIAEELINVLAGIPGLRVTARTSSFAFKGTNADIPTIARKLNVTHVLEGSVRKSGNGVRITAQLVDAESNSHLWSDTFDHELSVEKIFEIQSEIANAVAAELVASISPRQELAAVKAGPVSLAALEAYHNGLFFLRQIETGQALDDDKSFEAAIERFQASIAADPGWAPSHAALGRVYHFWVDTGRWDFKFQKSKEHILEAIRIDPGYGPAYESLGYILHNWEGDLEGARAAYERGRALGADVSWGYAILNIALGKFDEAISEYRRALANDPLSLQLKYQLGAAHFCAGDHQSAVKQFDEYFAAGPWESHDHAMPAYSLIMTGEPDQGLEMVEKFRNPRAGGREAIVYALLGMREEAAAVLAAAEPQRYSVMYLAAAAARLGERDRALDLLKEASTRWPEAFWHVGCFEELRRLRDDDPRFETLFESMAAAPG